MRKTVFVLVVIALVFTASLGFSAYKIGYVVKTVTNPYFSFMGQAAKQEADKLGVDLIFKSGKSDSDVAGQISIIEDMITQKVDAIIVTPANTPGIAPAVKAANRANIPIIMVDTAGSGGQIASFIATDNYLAGVMNGVYAATVLLQGKGKIALLEGTPGASVDDDRKNGFLHALEGYPEITVVADQITHGDQSLAQSAMDNILTAHPDLNLVWTINEPAGFGAARSLQLHRIKGVGIVTMDGSKKGAEAVKNGEFSCDVMQFPAKMAQLALKYAVDAIQGKSVPSRVDSGEALITPENAQWGVQHGW
jgi:fructose transport system substrate-binding protein